ncbi:Glycosyltransferase Family 1 protein [Rhizophagus diaphanus]|nr:Glycosyltransferase Family 1 protein [Rhizophagus diaphanus] [Rhizophagus sp. MUCL 43196]
MAVRPRQGDKSQQKCFELLSRTGPPRSYTGGRSHLKPMLDIAAVLIERGHNVIMLSSGNYTPASENPTIKQISLGPPLTVKNTGDSARLIQAEFDYIDIKNI